MSRRVFYIVHLDKGRIAGLSIVLSGLLMTAFATGYRLAPRASSEPANVHLLAARDPIPDGPEDNSLPSISLSENNNSDRNTREPVKRERVNLLEAGMPSDSVKRKRDTKPSVATPAREKEKAKPKKKVTKKVTKKKTTPKAKKPAKKTRSKDVKKKPEKKSYYVLQMGAYQSRDAALRLAAQIRKHGINAYVRKTGRIHAVRTDGTTNRKDLFKLERKLKSLNFTPITVKIKDR